MGITGGERRVHTASPPPARSQSQSLELRALLREGILHLDPCGNGGITSNRNLVCLLIHRRLMPDLHRLLGILTHEEHFLELCTRKEHERHKTYRPTKRHQKSKRAHLSTPHVLARASCPAPLGGHRPTSEPTLRHWLAELTPTGPLDAGSVGNWARPGRTGPARYKPIVLRAKRVRTRKAQTIFEPCRTSPKCKNSGPALP
jgi:hypothetical protein